MDAALADRLATSIDPKALAQLKNNARNPAVGKAIAAQFGAFLMQGLFQDASGNALPMAGGTGGPEVSAMFASVMSRNAAQQDQFGLADTIYKSIAAQQNGGTASPSAPPAGAAAPPAASPAATPTAGLPLTPYWQDNGHRPIGHPLGRFNLKAGALGATRAPVVGRPVTGGSPATPTATSATTTATTAAPAPVTSAAAPAASAAGSAPTVAAGKAPPVAWRVVNLPRIGQILMPPAEPSASSGTAPTNGTNGGGSAASGAALPWSHHWSDDGASQSRNAAAPLHTSALSAPATADAAGTEAFAEAVAPALRDAAARLGVSPRILLAQAALETGWGHSVVGNNIFGIKAGAGWSGQSVSAETHEMAGGHLVADRGSFRAYANVTAAVDDYVSLVASSGRYRAALGAGDNVTAYAAALAAGGYATDRDYAAKLAAVADSPRLDYAAATLDDAAPGQLVSAHG